MKIALIGLLLFSLVPMASCDCAFIVGDDLKPLPPKPDEVKPRIVEEMSCS